MSTLASLGTSGRDISARLTNISSYRELVVDIVNDFERKVRAESTEFATLTLSPFPGQSLWTLPGLWTSTLASLGTSGRETTAILALAFEQSKGELVAANEYIFEIVSLVSSKEELVASECVFAVRAGPVLATLALPSSPEQLFTAFLGSSSSILARFVASGLELELALVREQSKGELFAATNEYVFEFVSLVSSKGELVASERVWAGPVLATLALSLSPERSLWTFLGLILSTLVRLSSGRKTVLASHVASGPNILALVEQSKGELFAANEYTDQKLESELALVEQSKGELFATNEYTALFFAPRRKFER